MCDTTRASTRSVIGCLLAIVVTIAVTPNLSEPPALVLFAVTAPSAYVALGGPRFSYVGVQIVVAFAIVALAEQAHTDVQPRVYGTLLGTALGMGGGGRPAEDHQTGDEDATSAYGHAH